MITTSYAPDVYTGDGATTSFAITFDFQSTSTYIKVSLKNISTGVITVQTNPANYSVSGSNVVMVSAPSSSYKVIIERSDSLGSELQQGTDYTEYDKFPAETHESALDLLTLAAQLANEKADRSIKMDPSITGIDTTIEGTPAAGDTIMINADADGWEYGPPDTVAGTVVLPGTLGIISQTAENTWTARSVAGTANEITVTNGDGVSGNPTVSIPAAVTLTGKTLTGGTFSSPTLTTPVLGTPSSGTLTSCTGLPEAGLSLTDVTTNNASSTKHGFCPKLSNTATTYLDGTGTFSTPSSGSCARITSTAASSSASISFTGLGTSTYRGYYVTFSGLVPATDNVNLYVTFSTDNGSSYLAGTAYAYTSQEINSGGTTSYGGSNGAAQFTCNKNGIDNSSTYGLTGWCYIDSGANENTKRVGLVGMASHLDQAGSATEVIQWGGTCNTSSATVNAIKFAFSSGNIASGTITIYGLAI